jgi:hypothetical protein
LVERKKLCGIALISLDAANDSDGSQARNALDLVAEDFDV